MPQALILGRIRGVWFDDGVVREEDDRFIVDAAGIDPVGRLGGEEYVLFGQIARVPRP